MRVKKVKRIKGSTTATTSPPNGRTRASALGHSLDRPDFGEQPQHAAFSSFMRTTSKAALLIFPVVMLLAGGTAAVRAQSALDGFDPNANGNVQVVVVQPDGKILIGG